MHFLLTAACNQPTCSSGLNTERCTIFDTIIGDPLARRGSGRHGENLLVDVEHSEEVGKCLPLSVRGETDPAQVDELQQPPDVAVGDLGQDEGDGLPGGIRQRPVMGELGEGGELSELRTRQEGNGSYKGKKY